MVLLLLAALAAIGQGAPSSTSPSCDEALRTAPSSGTGGAADIDELLALRDIGGMSDDEPPFTVSPDGTKAAVPLRRANAARNDYCTGFVIVDLRTGAVSAPFLVDGGITLARFDLPTIPDFSGGVIETVIPRWSPDGRHIAYRERRAGVVQVMQVSVTGGNPVQLTHSLVDIRSFRWSADGNEIIYEARPDDRQAAEAVLAEGKGGYRYDIRWMPEWRSTPFPKQAGDRRFALSIASASERELPTGAPLADDDRPGQGAVTPSGNAARIAFQTDGLINGPKQIVVRTSEGRHYVCASDACTTARWVWWRDSKTILYGGPTGWAESETQISSWHLPTGEHRLVLRMPDKMEGCRPSHVGLLCVQEGSKQPRQLMRIDYRTGKESLVYDPNPQWQGLNLGRVRRIYWRNDIGLECFGDLVLPPGVKTPSRLPLVIVGYHAKGFLRGGSGDLFPIYPLAARGFAVLVYNRPAFTGYLKPVSDQAEADRRGFENWSDKKSGASSIMTAISLLARDNIIDPQRVGLTGFSDGVDKATYTLIHNHRFKAVAMAACCSDSTMVNIAIGPYLSNVAMASGYPALKDRASARTKEYSLAVNADIIDTPILIQAADREYLNALEIEAAFRQEGKALALYVFPDEYHIFWQPAHRRAAYLRNIAWFEHYLLRDGRGPMSAWIAPVTSDPLAR